MRAIFISLITSIAVFSFYFFVCSDEKTDLEKAYKTEINKYYRNYPPQLPEKIEFAGEPVPLNRNDVREGLDRELLVNMYWHSQTFLFFKRANRYFPLIEEILKKNNISDDFKYLALIESGFANVVSPAGASGFWQFMKATGQKHKLIINDEVDERYNLEKATHAACEYLQNSYNIFKSWTLAAAAYNMGDGGVRSQLNSQKVGSYYDLFLNQETARYVYRILAIKAIFENPKDYGFYFREADLYPPVRTHVLDVDTAIASLADFALNQGITYKILKEYNPWLRKTNLVNKEKNTYQIHIPYKEDLLYSNYLEKLNKKSN